MVVLLNVVKGEMVMGAFSNSGIKDGFLKVVLVKGFC